MRKRLQSVPILFSLLLVALVLDSRGRATPPPDTTRSGETAVDVEEYLYSCLRQHNQIKDPRLPFEIYVQKLQGRKLINPVLKHRDAHGEIDYVAQARSGELTVLREKGKLRIHLDQMKLSGADGSHGFCEQRDLSFDLPKDFGPK